MVFRSIAYNLASLLRFSGRDGQSLFWPYAGFVLALAMAAGMAGVLPEFLRTFARIQAFAQAHPDQADVMVGAGSYSITIHGDHPELMPDFMGFFRMAAAGAVGVVALMAGAVCRRLHDRGHSGLWGLAPLPFLAVGLFGFTQLVADLHGSNFPFQAFLLLFANNILYMLMLGLLGAQLALPGRPEANRFGPLGDISASG